MVGHWVMDGFATIRPCLTAVPSGRWPHSRGTGPLLPLGYCLLLTSLDEIDVWSVGLESSLDVPQLAIGLFNRAGQVEPA